MQDKSKNEGELASHVPERSTWGMVDRKRAGHAAPGAWRTQAASAACALAPDDGLPMEYWHWTKPAPTAGRMALASQRAG